MHRLLPLASLPLASFASCLLPVCLLPLTPLLSRVYHSSPRPPSVASPRFRPLPISHSTPAGEGNLEALGAALNGGEAPAREEIVIPPIVDVNDDVPKR